MDEINRKHIAAAGHLDFDADADVPRPSVDGLLLDPIDAACFSLRPTASVLELGVEHGAEDCGSVPVAAFFDEERKVGYDSTDFVE
jgi:hypothetical protein